METGQLNFTYDLGNLTLFDTNLLNFKLDLNDKEMNKKLQEKTLENIRRIIQSFHSIKKKRDEEQEAVPDEYKVIEYEQSQYEIKLPDPVTAFPRHKKIPEKQPLTRWEKFAQEKGIQNRKRGRMVFDEITKSWVPRYGRDSIKKIQEKQDIIREVKEGDDPKEDPFQKTSLEKKLNKEKQQFREVRNKLEAKGLKTKDFQLEKREEKKKADKKKTKQKKDENNKSLRIAQQSTASMGLFDKKAHKEEPTLQKKRKNTAPAFIDVKQEKKRDLEILELIERGAGSKKK